MEDVSILARLLDIVLHLDQHLALMVQQYGHWVYAILFAIIFCETGIVIFPFLPGDSLLFVAGAAAAAGGMDITTLCAVLFTAAVLGDNLNYWIGHAVGPRAFRWEQSRIFNKAALLKTHAFYEKHGGKVIIIARFLPLARTFAPFVAGVGRMTYPRFFLLDLLGGAIWIGSLTLAGYWFGNQPLVKNNLMWVILAIVGLSLAPAVLGALRHYRATRTAQALR
ncbi:MAG: DedA family protein [Sterolibacterium sp.]|jgi:membrane-associated protein|nr:DedA family protein [Sterolibacterium sp.]